MNSSHVCAKQGLQAGGHQWSFLQVLQNSSGTHGQGQLAVRLSQFRSLDELIGYKRFLLSLLLLSKSESQLCTFLQLSMSVSFWTLSKTLNSISHGWTHTTLFIIIHLTHESYPFNSTWLLVGSSLACIQHYLCPANFPWMLGIGEYIFKQETFYIGFLKGQIHFSTSCLADENEFGPQWTVNRLLFDSNSNPTSKHAPQVVREGWFCMQNNQWGNRYRGPTPYKKFYWVECITLLLSTIYQQ